MQNIRPTVEGNGQTWLPNSAREIPQAELVALSQAAKDGDGNRRHFFLRLYVSLTSWDLDTKVLTGQLAIHTCTQNGRLTVFLEKTRQFKFQNDIN